MKKGNEKFVGATIGRPHFEGMTQKDKGITLIALIITIIVMLILVGVTVNVALNGGLFDTAKQAASGMNMAQIREKAEMTKVVLIADAQTDSGITADIPTYRDRLLEEFDAKETDTDGNNIIEVNDKYVIIIKNSDLDIEVVEKTKIPANYLLISLGYETSNIEENGKIYGTNVTLNITRLMDSTQYATLRANQDAASEEITPETKYQTAIEYINECYVEEFTSIDEAVLYDINTWGYETTYETLEEALQDETVQADWGTTKEQLYYNFCTYEFTGEGNEMTEEELIDFWYTEAIIDKYYVEFSKYTRNLKVYVAIDGVEQETPIKESINLGTTPTTINYSIPENGTYEFILKTSGGEEIAREVLRVNNITTDENPYYITEEEAEDVWTTDGAGTITEHKDYTSRNSKVIVPVKIGTEYITKIGEGAFEQTPWITDIEIQDNILNIGESAFRNCYDLESIKLPNSITTIPAKMLDGCTNLTNVKIPETITSIGENAFSGCPLQEITIPKTVKSIGSSAFYGCKELKTIAIPEGIKSLNKATFGCCFNLESITLPDSLTAIGQSTFFECTNLKYINIPSNVKSIDGMAFYKSGLIEIEIPEGVTVINDRMFWGCEYLEKVTLPETITTIEKGSFVNCIALKSITIPNSVTSFNVGSIPGDSIMFDGCENLINIYFAAGENPIPDEDNKPWGVPNENVTVTKLTAESEQ